MCRRWCRLSGRIVSSTFVSSLRVERLDGRVDGGQIELVAGAREDVGADLRGNLGRAEESESSQLRVAHLDAAIDRLLLEPLIPVVELAEALVGSRLILIFVHGP